MRGEQEKQCLELVKSQMFSSDGKLQRNPFTGKSYLDLSAAEFVTERTWLISPDCHKFYFGLTEEDRIEFETSLLSARPNENESEIPDFVFENGFIEHFQITSSKTTRKGATHKKEERQFEERVSKEKEQLQQEWNETPSYTEIRSHSWEFSNPEHSHEYLKESFQSVWKHHIDSLHKYSGNKEVGIFLVEYREFALAMIEQVYTEWRNGMSQGDMREEEKFKCYRLSRDKDMLNFLYQYKDEISYVVFVCCDGLEVIRLKNIPYLLKLLPWDFLVYPLVVNQKASVYNISVPGNMSMEKDFNDGTT